MNVKEEDSLDIAVIGVACRFPGADNIREFWKNLINGVESIVNFSDEELLKAGASPEILMDPDFIKTAPVLRDIEFFDAEFFGYTPLEAQVMDPQRRLFLECCWSAFEDAGYVPETMEEPVGVYGGIGMNTYLLKNLMANQNLLLSLSQQQFVISNDKDFLTTEVSYKFNLKGPSLNVNTACSSSLVAIHLARQSLMLEECDYALAGGVSLNIPQEQGYKYIRDGVQSSDGHCRVFDAEANGTIWGSGCGVVFLKRLKDALEDGDNIRAVIKGSAINNDGAAKVGFTAPSIDGQADVIVDAMATAGVHPEMIKFVETHGTGTKIGDPIEVAALTDAFGIETDKKKYCAIGSVKSNVGHLNSAAGIAGFIKAVLALENKQLPPSLHYKTPNPEIDFENSQFFVNDRMLDLNHNKEICFAGVSSFAIGGTNAHVILAEGPARLESAGNAGREGAVLVFSARSENVLSSLMDQFADFLEATPNLVLKDVACTLQTGRTAFAKRAAIYCESLEDAISALRERKTLSLPLKGTIGNIELENLMEKWLRGEAANWDGLYSGRKSRKVSLPTYLFDRKRFWVDAESQQDEPSFEDFWKKEPDMANWFYRPSWKEEPLSYFARELNYSTKRWLILLEEDTLPERIVEQLMQNGDDVIIVTMGSSFIKEEQSRYTICPDDPSGYRMLLSDLKDQNRLPEMILHFWGLSRKDTVISPISGFESFMSAQNSRFSSLLLLLQAYAADGITKDTGLISFTNNVYDITGAGDSLPENATMAGICKVIQQEFNHFTCRTVDLKLPEPGSFREEKLVMELERDIRSEEYAYNTAYRNNARWVQIYFPIRLAEDSKGAGEPVRENDVIAVYSGLEGIGFLISRYLVKTKNVKLLILEDGHFPEMEDWDQWLKDNEGDNLVSIKITNARFLLENGCEYIGKLADISGLDELTEKIREAENRIGKVSGIIHAPGASNFERVRPIQETSPDTCRTDLEAVSYNFFVLDQLFEKHNLNFRILLSSLGSVLGGGGFTSIAVSSSIMASHASWLNLSRSEKWTVQLWDSWEIEWVKARKLLHKTMIDRISPSIIKEEEGLEAFERMFGLSDAGLIAISTTDLHARYDKWINIGKVSEDDGKTGRKNLNPRPNLEVDYVPPRNDTERTLTEILQNSMAIERIGIHDNFYELGGHSLLAMQVVNNIRETLTVNIDVFVLFDNPTVMSLAKFLDGAQRLN